MLSVMIEGSSLASSPISLSAGGQDEQPCEVNNSTTARGSVALAGRMTATTAQRPNAPDHRDMELLFIVEFYWKVVTTLETAQPPSRPFTDLPCRTGSHQPSNARRRPLHRPPPRHL